MGSAPALDFPVDRHTAWRLAVAMLVLLSCVAAASWWAAGPPLPGAAASLLAAGIGVLALGAGAGLVRGRQATRLRWDGRAWTVEFAGDAAQVGQVAVALDLGAWMLLRFHPDAPEGPWHARWVPVQRQQADGLWHALRCAVHGCRTGAEAPVRGAPGPA